MEELSEEKLLGYLAKLEKVCHYFPYEIQKNLIKLREIEAEQSNQYINMKKIEKIECFESANFVMNLLEGIYKNSFKRLLIMDEILEFVKLSYQEIAENIDFETDVTKLAQIGFTKDEIEEQKKRIESELNASNLQLKKTRRNRGGARGNITENVEEYTFYKDENFSLSNIGKDESFNIDLNNNIIQNNLKRKKIQQNIINNSKIINKKKKTKYTNISQNVNNNQNFNNNEPTYCFCNQISFGGMVACDSETCPYQWFHYSCVNLKVAPEGVWYCPECSQNQKKN